MEILNTKITKIKLKNFKNTEEGTLLVVGDMKNLKGSILGIYGQNGSGKTAVIDALLFLKRFIHGKSDIGKDIYPFITNGKDNMSIEVDVLCETVPNKLFDLSYKVLFKKNNNNEAVISEESLYYKKYEDGEWTRKRGLIESKEQCIKPQVRESEIKALFFDSSFEMEVFKVLAQKENKSFIFSEEFVKRIENCNKYPEEYKTILALKKYFESYLCVISNINGGLIDANLCMPVFCTHKCRDHHAGYKIIFLNLTRFTKINKEIYADLLESIEKSNKVLSEIVPGLTVKLHRNRTVYENNEEKIEVELLSVRDGIKTNMQYESEGIKKIVGIIQLLIFAYNNKNATIVIDEFDSGVFEYLLGEILAVMEKGMKGQLIFTSHNLRPLEILNKNNIVVTTTNPGNRYIRMKNIPTSHNMRNFYYRDIELDGQDEEIYRKTSSGRLKYALYMVGDLNG